jgi:imidazole glycerol phosphate synthase glutamine amidotransferase subunit
VRIAIVDYGAGNLPSVERALARAGATTERAASPAALAGADAIVLPGVGHFGRLAAALDTHALRAPLLAAIDRGVPFLGICLGMQALWDGSEEAPAELGLGVLAGRVAAMPAGVKLPHMGWNRVRRRSASRLLAGVPEDAYLYFAHSYAGPDGAAAVAVCDYGGTFAAAVERANVFGVQFHPEKSASAGAAVLANFVAAARDGTTARAGMASSGETAP